MVGTPTYFLVAVVLSGITEWVKNFFPEKLKENKKFLAVLAAVISVVGSLIALILQKAITGTELNAKSVLLFTGAVVGLSQTCYTVLLSTFKAIKSKLTDKLAGTDVDTDAIADTIIDKVKEGIQS